MAHGTKYQLIYTDNFGQTVQIDFQKDGYSGGVTTFKGGGDPLEINHDTASDFILDPILGTWVRVRILVQSNFGYSDLLTTDSREWLCIVTIAGSVYFKGYVH